MPPKPKRMYARIPAMNRVVQVTAAQSVHRGRKIPEEIGWLHDPQEARSRDNAHTSQYARMDGQNIPIRSKAGAREAISEYLAYRHHGDELEGVFLPSRSMTNAAGQRHEYVTALRPLVQYAHRTAEEEDASKKRKCVYGTYKDPDTGERKCIKSLDHHKMPAALVAMPEKRNHRQPAVPAPAPAQAPVAAPAPAPAPAQAPAQARRSARAGRGQRRT
jgi:hypothetical protein